MGRARHCSAWQRITRTFSSMIELCCVQSENIPVHISIFGYIGRGAQARMRAPCACPYRPVGTGLRRRNASYCRGCADNCEWHRHARRVILFWSPSRPPCNLAIPRTSLSVNLNLMVIWSRPATAVNANANTAATTGVDTGGRAFGREPWRRCGSAKFRLERRSHPR